MGYLQSSEQLRAARAILRLEQKALSDASKVSLATIKRLEANPGALTANRPTIAALQLALESAGVEFIDENGGGPGVRLRHRLSDKPRSAPLK
jgi:transcriptional regulator with XRE-family HTH domain